jgi:hypothetical protein
MEKWLTHIKFIFVRIFDYLEEPDYVRMIEFFHNRDLAFHTV